MAIITKKLSNGGRVDLVLNYFYGSTNRRVHIPAFALLKEFKFIDDADYEAFKENYSDLFENGTISESGKVSQLDKNFEKNDKETRKNVDENYKATTKVQDSFNLNVEGKDLGAVNVTTKEV